MQLRSTFFLVVRAQTNVELESTRNLEATPGLCLATLLPIQMLSVHLGLWIREGIGCEYQCLIVEKKTRGA